MKACWEGIGREHSQHTLRLGDKEPHKEEHGHAEAAKDEVRSVAMVADSGQHVGYGACNDKVEQPLGGGGKGDVLVPISTIVHFAVTPRRVLHRANKGGKRLTKGRSRAVGISDTRIQHAGPHPNWKNMAKTKMQTRAK